MNDEEYCCTGHIVGWMGTQTGGDLKCSDPERVRCPRVAPPHSAPNSLTSPTFGQAPSSDKQRRPRSIYWACRKTLSALAHAAQWWHSTNTITPECTNRNISLKLTEMRSLIHKMFSEAVISPAGLSLNSSEWDYTICDLQYTMVQKENSREKNRQWKIADSAFMWLCFWKVLNQRVDVLFCWAELTIPSGLTHLS